MLKNKNFIFKFILPCLISLLALANANADDNYRITDVQGALSGSWYDPTRSGEGFVFEFAENTSGPVATVYWFTHRDNKPYWLIGTTQYDPDLFDSTGYIEFELLEVSGTGFGGDFNSDELDNSLMGVIGFAFESCDEILATFSPKSDSPLANNSVEFKLQRITLGLEGINCSQPKTKQCKSAPDYYTLKVKNDNVYEFIDTERMPEWEYAGDKAPPGGAMTYMISGPMVFDLWEDGHDDVFVPLIRGYAADVDNTSKPLMFKNVNGMFVEKGRQLEDIPEIPGSRRTATIQLPNDPFKGLFAVQHSGDFVDGDSVLIASGDTPKNVSNLMEPFPKSQYSSEFTPTNVNAHAMGGGDINGDGRTDFAVGDARGFRGANLPTKPFFLVQKKDGSGWTVNQSDFLNNVMSNQPMVNDIGGHNLLLDLHLSDLNGDGLDDLVVGWGHGSTYSYVFFNQGDGKFSRTDSVALPEPPYGIDNSLHLRTYSLDISGNGANDLVIIYSRYEPYYSGYAFQFLINDGFGNFSDETEDRLDNWDESLEPDGEISWSDNFEFLDINGDGSVDIVGSPGSHNNPHARVWLNDGSGVFSEIDIKTDHLPDKGWTTVGWVEQKDGSIDTLIFNNTGVPNQTATKIYFTQYTLEAVHDSNDSCESNNCCL